MKRYLETRAQYATKALSQPTLDNVFGHSLTTLLRPHSLGHLLTCMSLAGAIGCSSDAATANNLMAEVRKQNEVATRERRLEARKAGELLQTRSWPMAWSLLGGEVHRHRRAVAK